MEPSLFGVRVDPTGNIVKMLTSRSCALGLVKTEYRPCAPPCLRQRPSRLATIAAGTDPDARTTTTVQQETASTSSPDISKELNKFTRQTAATFAPRSSTASKNPAVKGSVLYNVFEVQAWVTLVIGGLLSFNVLYPSTEPDIARLMGMWSIWMFTIPSLRAKECTPREKDALNTLFVAMPLMNILLPFIWKSFPFIFVSDTLLVLGVYYLKGIWQEVYGLPFMAPGALDAPLPGTAAAGTGDAAGDAGKQE